VRAGPLTAAPGAEAGLPSRPPSWRLLAGVWLGFVAVVLLVAGAVRLVAPGWLGDGERELPDQPLLMLDIFLNNLLLALVPLFGGWLAAGHRLARRPAVAALFLLLAGVVVARSLVTIGAVGGADPAWLAEAARWWLLELAALATAACTGGWLARNPRLRNSHGPEAIRRALAVIVTALAVAAVVEVLSA
jgi:hypothetical protein